MKKIWVVTLMICIVLLANINIGQAISSDLLENIGECEIDDAVNYVLEEKEIDQFKKAIKDSKRINILLLGKEVGPRTDTIVFVSFEPETKKVDMISIPRDTYYHEDGYDRGDQRKINAKYGRSKEKGIMDAVGKMLGGVPVHHYVTLNYQSVEQIVDALGGVEVNVPHQISDIPKGKQTLDGKKALIFLRHRKGYRDGDLGRIKAQQQFIKSAINKLLSIDLVPIATEILKYIQTDANEILEYVQTDMNEKEMLSYAVQVFGIKTENILIKTLPGKAKYKKVYGKKWSYYLPNYQKSKELMLQLYKVEKK